MTSIAFSLVSICIYFWCNFSWSNNKHKCFSVTIPLFNKVSNSHVELNTNSYKQQQVTTSLNYTHNQCGVKKTTAYNFHYIENQCTLGLNPLLFHPTQIGVFLISYSIKTQHKDTANVFICSIITCMKTWDPQLYPFWNGDRWFPV